MMYLERAVEEFEKLPVEVMIEFNKPKTVNGVKELENKYRISLSPLVIFLAIGEIKDEEGIKNYLTGEFDLSEESAKEIAVKLNEKIFAPLVERLLFLNPDSAKPMTLLKEKEILINIFKEGLIDELNNQPIIIEAVNSRIFYILARDLEFVKTLENALYSNQEKLTGKEFILDGKLAQATVGNWLKDFIKQNGSGMFDELALSKYLISSANTKKLSEEEKKLLRKFLTLYRNLKFFPESMPTDGGEGWEIIPVERAEVLTKVKKGKKSPLPPLSRGGTQGGDADTRLEELRAMASQYPEGSLER